MMDLNALLFRHQVALMRADAAACEPSRLSHTGLATLYAKAVTGHQRRFDGAAAMIRTALRGTGR